jgi:hypothetical protein
MLTREKTSKPAIREGSRCKYNTSSKAEMLAHRARISLRIKRDVFMAAHATQLFGNDEDTA